MKFNLLKGRFFEKKLGKKLQVLNLLPESVAHNFLKIFMKHFLPKGVSKNEAIPLKS